MSRIGHKHIAFKFETYFSSSPEPKGNDPVGSLWVAVVYQAIKDVEDLMGISQRELDHFGLVDVAHKYDLQKIFYEIESKWFELICLESDVDLQRVRKVINKMVTKTNFHDMPFTASPKKLKIRRKTIEN